jgi:glycosyltransferase involved in cell wall biosynthesis
LKNFTQVLKYSIVVPTYNRGLLLKETLTSLLSISHQAFEVIVVDDGSTDDTEQLVQSIASDKLRYFKVANRERGAARNYGAQQAKGAYINYFDSDDLAYLEHLNLADQVLEKLHNAEVFALSYAIRNDSNELLQTKVLQSQVSQFIADGNDLSCNGVFVRKDIALMHPFSEIRALSASEDYELWLRLSARYSFPCFPQISHAVIHHAERSTMNFNPEPLIVRKLLMLELAAADDEVSRRYDTSRLEYAAYSYIALHMALSGTQKRQAFQWMLRGFSRRPMKFLSRRTAAIFKHLLLR